MSDDLSKTEKLVSTTLKLRSALSIALIALAEIEGSDTLDAARAKARAARREARSTLASVWGEHSGS